MLLCRCLLLLSVFAAGTFSATVHAAHSHDPAEHFNRPLFGFNDTLDRGLVVPAAETYRSVLPHPIVRGVQNFFGNLQEPRCILGGALRGQPGEVLAHSTRFLINSTLGLGGVINWAPRIGIEPCAGGFDLTLEHWGVGDGPYLVLPFSPGRTMRDLTGRSLDALINPLLYIQEWPLSLSLRIVSLLDQRAQLLGLESLLGEEDRYIKVRELYLNSRGIEESAQEGEAEHPAFDEFNF